MKMTLARALKEKSRITGKMKYFPMSCRGNVYFVKDKPNVDIKKIYSEYCENMKKLIILKTAIAKANAANGICDRMFELEELKALMSNLNYIETDCTPIRKVNPVTGNEDITEKACFISFEEKEAEQNGLQDRINQLQDEIDEINATVTIEI